MRFLIKSAGYVLFVAAAMAIFAYATGGTVVQRCRSAYVDNEVDTKKCVDRMAHGGKL
jgi:hypothetical protein